MGVGRGGHRRTGNHGTSASNSSYAESSWRLKELTEEAVTIGVGSLFQHFTTCVEKDDFIRRRRQVPADVVVPHRAVDGNPSRTSSPTARFAPGNRRRQHVLASRLALHTQDDLILNKRLPYHKQHMSCFGGSPSAMDGG